LERLGLAELKLREKLLLFGEFGTSKTYSLLNIVLANPDRVCFVIDPDDGVAKVALELLGVDPDSMSPEEGLAAIAEGFPNLEYRLATDWEQVHAAFTDAHQGLQAGDWLMFEQLGKLWEMAANYYSKETFNIPALQKLMDARKTEAKGKAAVAKMRAEGKNVEEKGQMLPGGFEPGDWVPIKQLHNQLVMDLALARGVYNVAATTAVKDILPQERQTVSLFQRSFLELFGPTGAKPEGEKHNLYRYDTVVAMRKTVVQGEIKYEAGLVRDRGHRLGRIVWIDMTDKGFWAAYQEYRAEQRGEGSGEAETEAG